MRLRNQIAELEDTVLYNLNGRHVLLFRDGKKELFRDIQQDDLTLDFHTYLVNEIADPHPAVLETLIFIMEDMNRKYDYLMSLCVSKQLMLQ